MSGVSAGGRRDRLRPRGSLLLLLVLAATMAACTHSSPAADRSPAPPATTTGPTPTPSGTQPPEGSFLPLRIGNRWIYEVDGGLHGAKVKVVTVEAYEAVGALKGRTMAFKLRTAFEGTPGWQDEWERDLGSVILRDRKVTFDVRKSSQRIIEEDTTYLPSKLYVDQTAEHVVPGATWREAYESSDKKPKLLSGRYRFATWTVLAANEPVTTPAGTFPCLKLRRVDDVPGKPREKTLWFARNVGKVREEDVGGGQTESLRSYSVDPAAPVPGSD